MIWTLRNISLLFWVTSLLAVPGVFLLLPSVNRFFPTVDPFWLGGSVYLVLAICIGLVFNLISRNIILGLIKEGQAWERSGVNSKAEKKYCRAIRIYDSFLMWPFGIGKTVQALLETITRFHLNTGTDNENFKTAAIVYLKKRPEDREIAKLWLGQLHRSSIVSADEQDVLSILSEVHSNDPELSCLITDIFLGLERKDFSARKLYTQMQQNARYDESYNRRIQEVIGPEEEAPLQRDRIQLTATQPFMARQWDRMKHMTGFLFSHARPFQRLAMAGGGLLSGCKTLLQWVGSLISFIVLRVGKGMEFFKTHDRARFYLKSILISLVAVWLLYFMAGTVSHLVQPRNPEQVKEPVVVQIPKPFTIQVAAYLKQSHADRYVAVLKKKGVDASVKQVAGGGKTWFLVKVSEFEDKESAAAYGQKLKNQNIIDDFFVNNN